MSKRKSRFDEAEKPAVKALEAVTFYPEPDVAAWLAGQKAEGVTYTHAVNVAIRRSMQNLKPA